MIRDLDAWNEHVAESEDIDYYEEESRRADSEYEVDGFDEWLDYVERMR